MFKKVSMRDLLATDVPLKYAFLILAVGLPLAFEVGAAGRSHVELAWLNHTVAGDENSIRLSSSVVLYSPQLLPVIESLQDESPTFRERWKVILESPYPIYVSTYSDMGWDDPNAYGAAKQYKTGVSGRFLGGVLLINESMLAEGFEKYLETRPWDRNIALVALENEIRATFAHEVGHFYAVIKGGGKMSSACKDPESASELRTACSVVQENIIRRELQIPESCYYGWSNPHEVIIRYKTGRLACAYSF